jgi:hypothetical protein
MPDRECGPKPLFWIGKKNVLCPGIVETVKRITLMLSSIGDGDVAKRQPQAWGMH